MTYLHYYKKWLESVGISKKYMKQISGMFTAQAFITTDQDDNQITAFHPGAMTEAHQNLVLNVTDKIDLAIIAPDGREAMIQHAQECFSKQIPFIFDPGQGLPMFDKNELLTLASIIQKEAKSLNDSRLIASVFINRLEKKMKLQSDVTLAYGFKVNGNKITKKMLKSNHPYNTYYHFGLPPTPISYPGEDALRSLENILKTDYLFFVSDGNGEHRFSKTYKSHKKNIKLWKNKILKESDVK